jgi:hypothetical protein
VAQQYGEAAVVGDVHVRDVDRGEVAMVQLDPAGQRLGFVDCEDGDVPCTCHDSWLLFVA